MKLGPRYDRQQDVTKRPIPTEAEIWGYTDPETGNWIPGLAYQVRSDVSKGRRGACPAGTRQSPRAIREVKVAEIEFDEERDLTE